jgi:opacity protein-like surface antigen
VVTQIAGPDPVTGSTGTQTITIPGQTVVVNGQTITLPSQTITIPGQTITSTGTTAPQNITVPGQTAPVTGVVNASVLTTTVQITDVSRTGSVDTKIDFLSSARGKLGYAFGPNWMIYGTGGAGFAHATTTVTATESFTLNLANGPTVFSNSASVSGGATLIGWVAGGGIDWKFLDDGNSGWIIGAEYLHYEFPRNTIGLSDGGASVNFNNSHQTVDAIKGRISWLIH